MHRILNFPRVCREVTFICKLQGYVYRANIIIVVTMGRCARHMHLRIAHITPLKILVLLTAYTMLPVTFALVSPQERKAGVAVGDWAEYDEIEVTWSSNDPEAKADEGLILANETAWFKHIVTRVIDTAITFQNLTYFKNDTQKTNYAWVDVADGEGNGTLMFISAGLREGDQLYELLAEGISINETIARTYLGAQREVNHLRLAFTNPIETDPPQVIQVSADYFWDKATGILTERQGSYANQTENFLTSWHRSDKIVKTNLWVPDADQPTDSSSQPLPYWIPAMIAITLVSVLIIYRRTRTKPKLRKHRRGRKRTLTSSV